MRKRRPRLDQLGRPEREEADLVEEAQQPGLALLEDAGRAPAVPHLDGAPDQLIAARPLHAVDAEIGAADADRVLGRPGARRIIFGGDEAMARIDAASRPARRDRRRPAP